MSAFGLRVIVLVLGVSLAAPALAEDAAPSPDNQQQAAPAPRRAAATAVQSAARHPVRREKKPVPDPGTTGQAACIDETGDYQTRGNAVTFVIGLANKCDKRLKCTIDAYVVGAKGPSSGHATLILGATSSGAAAKISYAMEPEWPAAPPRSRANAAYFNSRFARCRLSPVLRGRRAAARPDRRPFIFLFHVRNLIQHVLSALIASFSSAVSVSSGWKCASSTINASPMRPSCLP